MLNTNHSPIDILCRELYRLNNDIDRLQMLITLKSHLHHLQLTSSTLQVFFSIFNNEKYRLQAVQELIPFIHPFITTESLPLLLDLFPTNEYRFNLVDILKTSESVKMNRGLVDILDNKYSTQLTNPSSTLTKVVSNTSGVFEKAKQFVCRVFGSGISSSSFDEHLSNKRLISSDNDTNERKKFHLTDDNLQFQPTTMSLSTTQSYTSFLTKSPPPSPIEPSSMMITQIHSILDNIDSVLDKIEVQTNSLSQRSISTSNSLHETVNLQLTTDQITQTTLDIVEHHLNMNDGSGDTTSAFINLIDSIDSSDDNDEMINNSH
ncbi:hypothetical protein I4U23_001688 [Adineta vaga]|nr:hypothetical protein I4U23_001688 [Adineta vaga]